MSVPRCFPGRKRFGSGSVKPSGADLGLPGFG
jgi:hypothetical protein